jgi:hypothetical protein
MFDIFPLYSVPDNTEVVRADICKKPNFIPAGWGGRVPTREKGDGFCDFVRVAHPSKRYGA